MSNKSPEANTRTEWSGNVPDVNSTPKALTEKVKTLHMSKHYLKADPMQTEFDWNPPVKTDHSSEIKTHQ